MNILLINIAVRPESPVKIFPVGLGYIATAIQRAGYSFDLIDIDAYRYTTEQIEQRLQEKSYDAVCLGCVVTGYRLVKELVAQVRRFQPRTTIVVGNTVASSVPEILLQRTEADVAVMGEGDETIVGLLQTLERNGDLAGVKGICYLDQGRFVATAARPVVRNIDELPWIDFALFDAELYIQNAKERASDGYPIPKETIRALPISTARGCIGRCTFCYHAFINDPYRRRSSRSIIDEVAALQQQFGINVIQISDELTFYKKTQVRDFAQAVIDSGLKFLWGCQCRTGMFDSENDLEIMELMKQAGCIAAFYSLESADPAILQAMRKDMTSEQFIRQTRLLHKAGLPVRTSLVFGYPQETPETIARTFDVCIECGIYPSSGFLLPQPGTPIYDYAREQGLIGDEEEYLLSLGDRQDLRLNLTTMSDEDLIAQVMAGARRCNDVLGLGLSGETLIKTGVYRGDQKAQRSA